MQKQALAALTAVGIAAAIAIPTIAFGNARNNVGNLHFVQAAQTPYTARLTGAAEVPPQGGDPDGVGAAAVTFDIVDAASPTGTEVCWDLSYSGLTGTPTAANIYAGAAGINGAVLYSFTNFLPASATGCAGMSSVVAQQIIDNPAGYYINVFTTDHPAPGGAIRGQLAVGPPPAGEAHLLPVPLRAYDSRDNSGAKIAALETRTISLAAGKDAAKNIFIAVPPGATAAIITLTVTETVGVGGFLKIYNAGIAEPATSSINWAGANQNIAVSTQVSVDAAGQVKVTGGANPTHFVIDVVGYLF
jgi:hypothetical protein